jgi:hypothetical protein
MRIIGIGITILVHILPRFRLDTGDGIPVQTFALHQTTDYLNILIEASLLIEIGHGDGNRLPTDIIASLGIDIDEEHFSPRPFKITSYQKRATTFSPLIPVIQNLITGFPHGRDTLPLRHRGRRVHIVTIHLHQILVVGSIIHETLGFFLCGERPIEEMPLTIFHVVLDRANNPHDNLLYRLVNTFAKEPFQETARLLLLLGWRLTMRHNYGGGILHILIVPIKQIPLLLLVVHSYLPQRMYHGDLHRQGFLLAIFP